jgi:hypothetical protein
MNAKTYIYWNLHKKCFSFRHKGLVYRHSSGEKLCLRDCSFKVYEKGRERVLKEKIKNVHAFIVTDIVLTNFIVVDMFKYVEVTYNPYKYATFVRKDNGEPIHDAPYVILKVIDNRPHIYAYVG